MKDDLFCVVKHDCDEDGPFISSKIFDDLDKALDYAEDVGGMVYCLDSI